MSEAHVRYRCPARYNDVLDVATSIAGHTPFTLIFHYDIANQSGVVCVSGDVKAACVDGKGKVKKIPAEIAEKLG